MDVDPPLASSIHIYDCTLPLILGAACNHQNSVLNPAFTIYHGVGFKVVDIEVMRRRVQVDAKDAGLRLRRAGHIGGPRGSEAARLGRGSLAASRWASGMHAEAEHTQDDLRRDSNCEWMGERLSHAYKYLARKVIHVHGY
jgi:hypothetical protein